MEVLMVQRLQRGSPVATADCSPKITQVNIFSNFYFGFLIHYLSQNIFKLLLKKREKQRMWVILSFLYESQKLTEKHC